MANIDPTPAIVTPIVDNPGQFGNSNSQRAGHLPPPVIENPNDVYSRDALVIEDPNVVYTRDPIVVEDPNADNKEAGRVGSNVNYK